MYQGDFDDYKKVRLLLLEDNWDDVGLIKRAMKELNHIPEFKVVDDENSFLIEIKTFQPDLILADYDLPTFNGFEALAIAQQECPEIPFVFVSGAIGEEIAAETVLNGASGLVLKSNLQKLPKVVQEIIDKQGFWHSKKARIMSKRISARIASNLQALRRIQKFLESKKDLINNDLQVEANSAIEDLVRMSEDLQHNDK